MIGLLLAPPAQAENVETGTPDPVAMVLFGSLEAGPTRSFAAIGLKRALGGGLDTSGFRTFLKIGIGQEPANRTPPRGLIYKSEEQVLLGHEWRIGDVFVALYAGSDVETEYRDDTRQVSLTRRLGARVQADLWATPTHATMVQASAYASTLDRRLWGRLAPGYRLADGLYLGPEIEAFHQSDYRKLRIGLHLTGLRLFGVTWRITGGWQSTSDAAPEAYATLGVHWRR